MDIKDLYSLIDDERKPIKIYLKNLQGDHTEEIYYYIKKLKMNVIKQI